MPDHDDDQLDTTEGAFQETYRDALLGINSVIAKIAKDGTDVPRAQSHIKQLIDALIELAASRGGLKVIADLKLA